MSNLSLQSPYNSPIITLLISNTLYDFHSWYMWENKVKILQKRILIAFHYRLSGILIA